jgi:formate-dependent nitrite reductase membrane component NrfD
MHFNLIQWLFTDPGTAGTNGGLGGPEAFHFYIPWLVFCSLGVLIAFYYSVEGRKRFVKSKPIIKYMLDRYLGWLAVICILGYPLIFARAYLYDYFFAWRVWRYLWLLALVVWAVLWLLYLVRKYPKERDSYLAYQKQQKYIPKSNKRKAASSR